MTNKNGSGLVIRRAFQGELCGWLTSIVATRTGVATPEKAVSVQFVPWNDTLGDLVG